MDDSPPPETRLSEELEKLSPFELISLRILGEIESSIRLEFEPEHAKVFYWNQRGKTYRWIAMNPFGDKISEGRARNLMWEARKIIKNHHISGEVSKINMMIVSEVLNKMIQGNPDNIDDSWPPPRVDWIDHIKEALKIYGLLYSEKEVKRELDDFMRAVDEARDLYDM